MSHFSIIQEKQMARIRALKEEVERCVFHTSDCPLLASQLVEAQVLTERLASALSEMREGLRSEGKKS